MSSAPIKTIFVYLFYRIRRTADQVMRQMLRYDFAVGYAVTLRIGKDNYKLTETLPWASIGERRKQKVNLSFRVDKKAAKFNKDTLFLLDRYVLKYRTRTKFVVRRDSTEILLEPHNFDREARKSLCGRNFDILLRKRSELSKRLEGQVTKPEGGSTMVSQALDAPTKIKAAHIAGDVNERITLREVSNIGDEWRGFGIPRTPGRGIPEVEEIRKREEPVQASELEASPEPKKCKVMATTETKSDSRTVSSKEIHESSSDSSSSSADSSSDSSSESDD